MTLLDLFERVGREVPGAGMSGFVASVNSEVERLWKMRGWVHYVSETTFSTTHSFADLSTSKVGGADRSQVSDADMTGLFDALHVGRTFTIDGTGYVVDEFTDANNVYVAPAISDVQVLGLSGSLPRVVFALPSAGDAVFRRMLKVFRQGSEAYDLLHDPCAYVLRYPSSGVTTLELRRQLSGDTPYVVRYLRAPVAASSLADSADIPALLEECLYFSLEVKYRSQRPPVSELDMLPWQRILSGSQGRREEELRGAKAAETLRSARRGRNAPVVFDGS